MIIGNFYKKIENLKDIRIYAIATFGGGTIYQIRKRIKALGGHLTGGFKVQMPDNYTPLRGAQSQKK